MQAQRIKGYAKMKVGGQIPRAHFNNQVGMAVVCDLRAREAGAGIPRASWPARLAGIRKF